MAIETRAKEDMMMIKLLIGTVLIAGMVILPAVSTAQVSVRVTVPLPPPIPFVAPPNVVVLPGTDIYAAPDIDEDIFFRQGWWWRNWEGRWYRSKFHDRGWAHYRGVPTWHRNVPRDWRHQYRANVWGGHPWRPPRIHHDRLNRHWRDGHWRRDHGWDRPMHRRPDRRHPGEVGPGRPPRDGRW